MTEREMEDLIAAYPEDFFPNKGFQLKGRQQSFGGVGRFDLLFTDRFNTSILMELKAIPAKYEVADQLARYRDELLARGERQVLMWLVAPSISSSIRGFMDRIGIEYTEIHEAEFRLVACRYGITHHDQPAQEHVAPRPVPSLRDAHEKGPETEARKSSADDARIIHKTFRDLMESAILPQRSANPDDVRLDGRARGPNGRAGFFFLHHNKVWQINLDTHYEPLKIAYDLFIDGDSDPFVEEPTQTGKGTRLRLRQGSKKLFIYLSRRKT